MNYKISPHKYFLKGRGGLPLQDNNIFFFLESKSEFFVKLKRYFWFLHFYRAYLLSDFVNKTLVCPEFVPEYFR